MKVWDKLWAKEEKRKEDKLWARRREKERRKSV